MQGFRIVIKPDAEHRPSTPSPNLVKRKKPSGPDLNVDLVFVLEDREKCPSIPSIFEGTSLPVDNFQELGQLTTKSIPEPFVKCDNIETAKGEVFLPVSENLSTPSSPTQKHKSSDKRSNHEHRSKRDAFDESMDELLTIALELKSLSRTFLPERDTTRMETKLTEYLNLLQKMEALSKDPQGSEKNSMAISNDVWEALEEGIHPDVYLIDHSESILREAHQNVKRARIIQKLLDVGKSVQKDDNSIAVKKE